MIAGKQDGRATSTRVRHVAVATGGALLIFGIAACGSVTSVPSVTESVPATSQALPESQQAQPPADEPVAPEADTAPEGSVAQQNALRSAETYIESQGFSRAGLIDQLSSKYGSQFTVKQATYAANAVGL
ncbi:MAG: Ltp family lipoprotein [Actinobacteria bacterium]|nr:Ltp family lipoprotein [Actinomycetota bacterium]